MSLLENYNPLKTIWLPGVEIDDPKGIIVIVGPNSSGKTLFLRDIENYLLNGTPDFVVCKGVAAQKPAEFQTFFDDLIEKNYVRQLADNVNAFRTYVPFMQEDVPHDPNKRHQFTLQSLKDAYDKFNSQRDGKNHDWFRLIGISLAALLSLYQRRVICQRAPSFNYKTHTPDRPVQGLYVNSNAKDRLEIETGKVFGNAVWLDSSENGVYQLRTAGSKNLPSHGEMTNPLEACKYSPIEIEGDGYRSYVGICISLLLATRPVTLIDEPELCLHPPQAFHIGRFIGQYAKDEHVMLVATHSSHVLRGILETGKNVTVVRLTRRKKQFQGHRIADQELVNRLRNPRTRAESILDGLFSKSVVLVESDGDREEYLAASEAIDDYPSREVHVVPVGGTGGFYEPLRFYRSLDIPTAIIADLDLLCDTEKVFPLAELLVSSDAIPMGLFDRLRSLVQQIKALHPPVSETDATEFLSRLSETSWNWQSRDDGRLRRLLSEFAARLRRVQTLKEGGVDAYDEQPDIKRELSEILNQLNAIGLFLVPVGELEAWVKDLMNDVGIKSCSKAERAAIAASRIREAEVKEGDIWEFVKKVFDYLTLST